MFDKLITTRPVTPSSQEAKPVSQDTKTDKSDPDVQTRYNFTREASRRNS